MFDKGLIETDAFMDMPMPTKALYFLLGMEADDEGFVSPKRVMRIYGGNEDDLRVLIAKEFVIQFESGVVVITDWHENNYLDKNRMKETKYQGERKLLALSSGKYKRLNVCLTDVEPVERRVEERSREERREEAAPDRPERHLGYLLEIPKEDINELEKKYNVYEQGIRGKAEDLHNYIIAKGKTHTYKNYKAFLMNALKRDFGIRKPEDIEKLERIREHQKASTISSPFAKSLAEKMKM